MNSSESLHYIRFPCGIARWENGATKFQAKLAPSITVRVSLQKNIKIN